MKPYVPGPGAAALLISQSLVFWIAALVPMGPVAASPGPDTVVVIANTADPESIALAARYAQARGIPPQRVCTLDLPMGDTMSLEDFQGRFLPPLTTCLQPTGGPDTIEAAVLIRGVPVNTRIPTDTGDMAVSTAAALSIWRSRNSAGAPILGTPPGYLGRCGEARCLTARWLTPYTTGAFHAGWTRDRHDGDWRMILVTALYGYTSEDAFGLVESALRAEREGPAGLFLLMDGGDAARAVRDGELDFVAAELMERGRAVRRVPFDGDLEGLLLGAFITGSAQLGRVIEGNDFSPGAIVDNLTSFGALPRNFRNDGETQTSVARWVARGVAGVHGTTAEPLSNSFPSRRFLLDYVDGLTLAEAYFKNLPYVYWRNLVLGDPMTAPYASRPAVAVEVVSHGDPGILRLRVDVQDGLGRRLGPVKILLDGRILETSEETNFDVCLEGADGSNRHLLVTARAVPEPKTVGWAAVTVATNPRVVPCPDQSVTDAHQMDVPTDAHIPGDGSVGGPIDLGAPISDQGIQNLQGNHGKSGGCRSWAIGTTRREPWVLFAIILGGFLFRRRTD